MTGTPELSRGDEYIVFYTGGPYDGQTDRRISTDGTWESEITVLAAVDGKETQLVYASPVAHAVGEVVGDRHLGALSRGEVVHVPVGRGAGEPPAVGFGYVVPSIRRL